MSRANSGPPEIPSYDKMLWPTLLAIKQLGDSGTKQEIEDRAIELAGYSEAQQSILHGDGPETEIRYRLAWARTYLKKVDALSNSSRGIWEITELGQSLSQKDMAGIPAQVRALSSRKATKKSAVQIRKAAQSPNGINAITEEESTFTSTVFEEWRERVARQGHGKR